MKIIYKIVIMKIDCHFIYYYAYKQQFFINNIKLSFRIKKSFEIKIKNFIYNLNNKIKIFKINNYSSKKTH